eukprot:TRINITY_DN2135_c0_g1_i1.p1 TRINITY_DN2135_c0_g1~~TRINITY_DN2135_c0_g1_i1.p1  ORF type:complete len:174 (-),score=26.57 TRINITY_DN2135_c0_g1_i1:84-605(-)
MSGSTKRESSNDKSHHHHHHSKSKSNSDPPIEQVVDTVLENLGIQVDTTLYHGKLKANLIFKLSHLQRIPPSSLDKLDMPLLLTEELKSIINSRKKSNGEISPKIKNKDHHHIHPDSEDEDTTISSACSSSDNKSIYEMLNLQRPSTEIRSAIFGLTQVLNQLINHLSVDLIL